MSQPPAEVPMHAVSTPGLAAIARLTESLGRAATLEAVYEGALDALQAGLGVERASVLLFDAANVMSFVAWRGLSDDYRHAVTGHTPWKPDSRDVAPICVPDAHADEALASYRPVFDAEGIQALGFFPLVHREAVIGKFMLYYREPHTFTEDEVQLAQTIAGQIAFGIARVRAEMTLKREHDRLLFLARASEALSSSLDYQTTLEHVAELVVRDLADWCAIDVREDDGEIRRMAVVHRDATRAQAVARLRSLEVKNQRTDVIRRVVEIGTPALVRDVDWPAVEARYSDQPETVEALRVMGAVSYMTVPLVAAGRSFGAITIVSADPLHIFDEHDLELAFELGRRAGYAIDNARLFREAQAANRAKDEFLVTLSHELRTPMTATLGWAAMLRGHDLSPDNFRLAIETIDRSTRAQAKLVDDILDVSRIVTGKLELSVVPLNVRDVVDAAVDAIRPSIAAKHLELHLTLSTVPTIAVADASRLQQVLWNLLSNAVKFTPSGGSVFVRLHPPDGGVVRIEVADTGAGIPRRFLPHVFERFRQAESGASRSHGGLGLGLAIVKSIIEMHGGKVTVASDGEGWGSTFTLTLPLAAPSRSESPQATQSTAPLALSGVSVLLVEDEDDTRYMLSAALQGFGARVTSVRSVAAAMESIEALAPNVVISDIAMPDVDGYGLMLRLRESKNEQVRGVPAIALTAHVAPEDRERALASGFNYHLGKPIDPLLVVKTVREAAGR
ncbi:MAG TPA: ATP-binding protein [Thermoanaerobaculia bacterium]|nr:ATP-binding protein [Thermoanaerobaculia bacterium]